MPDNILQKRIRIFAGPNGSGKSTLYKKIKNEFPLRFGYYLNADEINDLLIKNGFIDVNIFGIKADINSFMDFIKSAGWGKYADNKNYKSKWKITGNIISINRKKIKDYDSAILTDYIRNKFLESGITFTFETVMSHPSKIDFISRANKNGYKVYLYFISTEDCKINQNRVKIRVKKGGHSVSSVKVRKRYYNTMSNLKSAAIKCYRSYIFDNTTNLELILSINPQNEIKIVKDKLPKWVNKYLLT